MKRSFAFTAAVLLLLVMTVNIPVLAASGTYDLDELGLQVTIPSGYLVITRDTPASDPIFSTLGTTKSATSSRFEAGNIYLDALSDTYNEEIVVTNTPNTIDNFSRFSDTELNALASVVVDQYPDYGAYVSRYEIYSHAQAKFIKLYFTDTANAVHGLQYYTIYGGQAMNFTMRSYEGSLSSRQESAIKAIVDSIQFDNAPPAVPQGEDTDAFPYIDTESGVVFTVPENWEQKEFSKDREMIDAKFVSTKESGCTIIYASTDVWEQTPASDRVGYSRSDLNNAAFTKKEIAELYNVTADEISTVTYNGVQYYKSESDFSSDAYGVELSLVMTQLIYFDNGWMYMFQFSGQSTHKLYSDFESLINSVQYPVVSGLPGADYSENASSDADGSVAGVVAAMVLLLMVVVLAVVFIVNRRKESNRAVQPSCTSLPAPPVPKPQSTTIGTVYCENCGQLLPSDSQFCHICGTKINKEISL